MDIRELYQELIMDHGTEPRNFSTLENATHIAEGYNPLCGDKIQLYLQIENEHIIAAHFQGAGCAISTASASLMTESLLGKTPQQATLLFDTLQAVIMRDQDKISIESEASLGKLAALSGVHAFPARVKCATLPWHTLLSALKNIKLKVTTE
jgi:nitrogen fixation NifU-like protein